MIFIPRWILAILIYIGISYIIIRIKPPIMFDPYGKPKEFGLGISDGKSVLAPVFIFPILALLCYFITSIFYFIL